MRAPVEHISGYHEWCWSKELDKLKVNDSKNIQQLYCKECDAVSLNEYALQYIMHEWLQLNFVLKYYRTPILYDYIHNIDNCQYCNYRYNTE